MSVQSAQSVAAPAGGRALSDSAAVPSQAPAAPGSSLLATVIAQRPVETDKGGFLQQFLAAESAAAALAHWLGDLAGWTRDAVLERINHDVAAIDEILNRQLNAVLHHPRFQRLEAAWRGLAHVVAAAEEESNSRVAVRVLNVSWQEAGRDFERAPEFDKSRLFQKVYEEEFGTPGGKPYGLLIGDYEVGIGHSNGSPINDLDVLRSMSQVAAAAFCPFVASASPGLLELGSFAELERSIDLERTFGQPKYIPWRSLRGDADLRFAGLVLPRILLRSPYQDDGSRTDGFRFFEDVSGPDHSKYLWGNASFAFAVTAIRAFAETGWLSDVCGVRRGEDGGGLVTRFTVDSFRTDRRGIAPKPLTDVVVTDAQEKELSELGFIPLCQCHDSEFAAFYSCRSVQKPAKYDRAEATVNAQLSAMLNYILCASQFARYLKVMIRDRVGSSIEPAELEAYLNNWLHKYVTSDDEASADVKARFPLREAQVAVRADPSRPGHYLATIHLRPHFQFDQLNALVQFDKVEMAPLQ